MVAEWTNKYIGIPFQEFGRSREGIDCWGLVMLVLREQFTVNLPDFTESYTSTTDKQNISRAVLEGRERSWEKVAFPEAGNVLVVNIASCPVHMGVMIDNRLFIHAERGLDVSVADTENYRWRNRIDGYYRHK